MIVSDTAYGRRKARRFAQTEANRAGRRVYLQMERRGDGKFAVHVASDGRGPRFMGMPWVDVFPTTAPE